MRLYALLYIVSLLYFTLSSLTCLLQYLLKHHQSLDIPLGWKSQAVLEEYLKPATGCPTM